MKALSLCLLAVTCSGAMLATGCIFEQVEGTFIPADNPYATPLPKLALPESVPMENIFHGKETYQKILEQAKSKNWRSLPLGERVAHVALTLSQVPYQAQSPAKEGIPEVPTVNFDHMDEREFIDTALAVGRVLNAREIKGTPEELLHLVQIGRYRGGICDGTSDSRMEVWDEIFSDSEKRGLIFNVTRQMGGVRAARSEVKAPHETHLDDHPEDAKGHVHVIITAKSAPALVALQKEKWLDAHNKDLPLYYLKREQLVEAERYIQNGDLLAFVCEGDEDIDEVGIAVKGSDSRPRVIHMSKAAGHAVVDLPLSEYLAKNLCAGVMVARPLEAPAF